MKVVLRGNGRPVAVETDEIEAVEETTEPGMVCAIRLVDRFNPVPVDQAGAETLAETIYRDYLRNKGFCEACYMHDLRAEPCHEACCQIRAVCLRAGVEVSRYAPREGLARVPERDPESYIVCGWFASSLLCSLLFGFRYGLFRAVEFVGGLSLAMLLRKGIRWFRRRR